MGTGLEYVTSQTASRFTIIFTFLCYPTLNEIASRWLDGKRLFLATTYIFYYLWESRQSYSEATVLTLSLTRNYRPISHCYRQPAMTNPRCLDHRKVPKMDVFLLGNACFLYTLLL